MATSRRIRRVATDALGHESLRPGQEEAVAAVLDGRDTLAVMPTGAGKSAIYQVAGALLPGPTIVVSPLIALQRDQVEALDEADVGQAAEANSSMPAGGRREVLEDLAAGELEFLFLAPEQLANPETLDRVLAAQPSLFVVDEAHCVTSWGHDFRPDYLRLGSVIEALGHPRVLALTATASPPVRHEIVADLRMRDPVVVVRGFDRPNIRLSVEAFHDEADKREALLERARAAPMPGIAYVATRRRADEVADALAKRGVRAAPYHAGLRAREREATQRGFMDGELEVVVATTAFGMGIDKPDVRFVFHHDVSESLDSYYQEVGRAGRDGEPAEATLFYRQEDLGLRRFFAGSGRAGVESLQQVTEALDRRDGPTDLAELGDETGLSPSRLVVALERLEKAGGVEVLPGGDVASRGDEGAGAAEEAGRAVASHHRVERSRVEMMRAYCETRDCRRQFLLNYFGEPFDDPCPNCDNCEAGTNVGEDVSTQPFPVSSRVRHRAWGQGTVVRYEGDDKAVVLFDEVGYKTLWVPAVVEGELLEPDGRD